MKLRIGIVAACFCFVAAFGLAVQAPDGRMIASLDIVNEDSIPHSVTIDQNSRTVRVHARNGGNAELPPGRDVAMRVGHGTWRIFGDSGREMNVRIHHGQDYRLHLRPYVHGDVRTLVGVIDDGYNHFNAPLLDMREHPHFNDYPPDRYDPSYHEDHYGRPGYQYHRTDSHESLGHAIHEAFDGFLHNLQDQAGQREDHPYYVPNDRPWR